MLTYCMHFEFNMRLKGRIPGFKWTAFLVFPYVTQYRQFFVLLVRHRNQRITIEPTPLSSLWTRAEIENRFSGNDQDVLCGLGNVTPRQ